ncbi:Rid family hydrolase [Saliphagus sp. GCM10025334]
MELINTSDAPRYSGSSQGIVRGDRVYVEGQIGLDPADLNDPIEPVAASDVDDLVNGDIKAQTSRTIDNIEAVLEEAGTSIDNVVKAVVFLDDKEEFDAMNEVYAERFPEPYPARFAAEVDLPVKVQIVAIAALPGENFEVIETRDAIDYDLPLSQGYTLNDTVYVQGMVGVKPEKIDPDTGNVPMADLSNRVEDDISDQTQWALTNIKNILGAVDTEPTLDDVMKTMVYLDDKDVFFEMNENYCDVLNEPRPARRCWEISSLFTGIEIVATAAREPGSAEVIRTHDALQYSSGGREYTSQGWTVGDTVYVHGMVGIPPENLDPDTHVAPMEDIENRLVEGGIEEEMRVSIENAAAVLEEAGASLDDAVKVGVYFDDMDADFEGMQRIYKEYFSEPYPTRYMYEAEIFSAVEIEVVAEL